MSGLTGRRVGFALVMLSLLAAGLSTGTRIYYVLFFVLLAMLLLGFAAALWTLSTLRLDVKGVRPRVTRGDAMMTVFTVRHTSLLPVAAVHITMSVPSSAQPSREINLSTPPFAERTFRHVIPCPHRGVYQAGVTRIRVTDIFGLVRLSKKPDMKLIRMEVLPRVTDVPPMPLKAIDTGPEMRSFASEDNAAPSDIRNWQNGDELKRVHWKLSLRRRELMVRTYEESARPDTLVVPDLSDIDAEGDDRLTLEDLVCEAALNAAKAQLEAGDPVRMPLVAARPGELSGKLPADFPAFADAMLRVRFDSPYGYDQVLLLMLSRMQRTGGAVLVTARVTSRIADIAMRMQRSGIATKLIWVSGDDSTQAQEMLARLNMLGVKAERLDPWPEESAQARPAEGNVPAGDGSDI